MPQAKDQPLRKEGELLKYKNVFSGWGKRYFRLERTYLHYFETKFTHKPLGTVTRGEIVAVKVSDAYPNMQNVFEIVQKSGVVWYCQAATPSEMVGWMQALSPVPIMVDANKYPMIPMEQASFVPPTDLPTATAPPAALAPTLQTPSPYSRLMEEAHHTAYTNQTPHECHHDRSPPPPYSAQGYRPQPPPANNNFPS